jgi:hypothetical protein
MSKKLVTHKFFSRELIPKSVADEGITAMEEFETSDNSGRSIFRFKNGDEVVHKYNTEQRMVVQEVRQKKQIIRGEERIRLDGIVCHWWYEGE